MKKKERKRPKKKLKKFESSYGLVVVGTLLAHEATRSCRKSPSNGSRYQIHQTFESQTDIFKADHEKEQHTKGEGYTESQAGVGTGFTKK